LLLLLLLVGLILGLRVEEHLTLDICSASHLGCLRPCESRRQRSRA